MEEHDSGLAHSKKKNQVKDLFSQNGQKSSLDEIGW